jgi:hypothetical protein
VTRSACYFVVRALVDPDLPASGGAFAPVTVRAPAGSLVNADRPAAVAAIHFPDDDSEEQGARERLAFEELFLLQLAVSGLLLAAIGPLDQPQLAGAAFRRIHDRSHRRTSTSTALVIMPGA